MARIKEPGGEVLVRGVRSRVGPDRAAKPWSSPSLPANVRAGRRDWLQESSAAPPSRLFDASARLSLTGCVPAEPASVSPRPATLPQRVEKLNSAPCWLAAHDGQLSHGLCDFRLITPQEVCRRRLVTAFSLRTFAQGEPRRGSSDGITAVQVRERASAFAAAFALRKTPPGLPWAPTCGPPAAGLRTHMNHAMAGSQTP